MALSSQVFPPGPPFRTAAVLGAGVMGAQIAAHLANAGLRVQLLDIPAPSGPANGIVEKAFKRLTKLKPPPLFDEAAARRIELGNFDEHLERIGEAEWVIEVVVERLDVKRDLLERVEEVLRPDAVVSTNTSGLPIAQIAEGRSESFRRRFLGTHFFNPPRYLQLFEIIPTEDTDPSVISRVEAFARVHLGKGTVVAKDTPNFIGNRVGVFAMMRALRMLDEGYTIEEIDAITGPLIGRAKSATFRTADVVGLDTLVHVAKNLHEAIPEDESRAVFEVPAILDKLVEAGALGAKAGAGFYKKEGKEIHSIDPATGGYTPATPIDLGDLGAIKKAGGLEQRMRALFDDQGRAGQLFRTLILETLAYAARRVPEISDNPADVDRAIRWGFGWKLGPFETWDALGVERVSAAMKDAGIELPDWARPATAFYRGEVTSPEVYAPSGWMADPRPDDELSVAVIAQKPGRLLWSNEEAALHDMGDGIALYEFRSKANALGTKVMLGLEEAIGLVEGSDALGLVVGNDGDNFSVGANLAEMAEAAQAGRFSDIDALIRDFQRVIQRVRYARKPVVVAAQGKTLGGGCEMLMATPNQVAAAETYAGLVELGVGLIPAGTGTTRMAEVAAKRAASDALHDVQPFLVESFKAIAMAKVAMGAREAANMGLLGPDARLVMNPARRLHVAKQEVLRLVAEGYAPPPADDILVTGRQGRAVLEQMAYNLAQGRFASEYDRFLAVKLASILSGGDLSGVTRVSEEYMLELEREVFLSLLGEKKTQERIHSILTTNKPLRN